MSDQSTGSKGTSESGAVGGGDDDRSREIDGRDYDLHSVIVNYEDASDRCTVYPRRDRCLERVEAWLSADLDVFVGLEEMR